ncbi:MAG: AAA family ATPase [Prolixibacteraceae bacterium]
MKAVSIHVHNFRTFDDALILLQPYSILIGVNNAGKSNLVDAIRIFYEKDIKYEETRDFPKFGTDDDESWIEIEYKPTPEELASLREEYKTTDGTFKVRKYLKSSEKDDEGKVRSGIYGYINGQVSGSHFYGVKNVSQGKFGEVIYIPAIKSLDDTTKFSGPSVLRDLTNNIFKQIINESPSFKYLTESVEKFSNQIKSEGNADGVSLASIENEITHDLSGWGTEFKFIVNPLEPDVILKSLFDHSINDDALGISQKSNSYGQGFQRQLIYSLIKISAKHQNLKKTTTSSDFSPNLVWILFEEPEAFLHPSQIVLLDENLRALSEGIINQVLITSHNPEFISKNVQDIPAIARFSKEGCKTIIGQVSKSKMDLILDENQSEIQLWLNNPKIAQLFADFDRKIEVESLKYALWLDVRRCKAFFSSKVLLVEGSSEVTIINNLFSSSQLTAPDGGVFIHDCMGKFNIHRFMNLFGELKIYHSVLMDGDNGKYPEVDQTIQKSKNEYTLGIETLPVDLETSLGIQKNKDKPMNLLWNLKNSKIDADKLAEFRGIVEKVLAI